MEPDRAGVDARSAGEPCSADEPCSAEEPRGEHASGFVVVTVTHSPGEALDRFLDSVQAATARPVRVVLADTGSTDGAPERVAQRSGGRSRCTVRLLRIGEDVGRGAGANRGVAELGPDVGWIAIADPDVEWGEGSLDELLAAAARHPRAGALGPLVRDPGGVARPSAWDLPSVRVLPALADVLLGSRPVAAPAVEGRVGWLVGSCLLLRRAAWESVDGFDPRYIGPYDDVDLGERLTRAGWLCVYVPSAEVLVPTRPADPDGMAAGRRRYLTDRHTGLGRAVLEIVLRLRATVSTRAPAALRAGWTRAPPALRAAARNRTET